MHNTYVIKLLWTCLCLAYWALLPKFYLVYAAQNRHSLTWTHGTHVVILLAILTLGSVYFAIAGVGAWVVSRWPASRRWMDVGLYGAAGAIFLRTIFSLVDKGALLPDAWQHLVNAHWVKLALYALPFLGMAWRPRGVRSFGKVWLIGLGILTALFLVVPWTWPTFGWDDQAPPPPRPEHNASTNSIYVFMFDAWSPARSIADPKQLARMPNLTRFMERADVFENAQSPALFTQISMPRFLYQNDAAMRSLPYDEIRKLVQHNRLQGLGLTSIFDLAPEHYKIALGFYLHYPSLIGRKVDYCARYNAGSDYRRLFSQFTELLWSQAEFLRYVGVAGAPRPPSWTLDTNLLATQRDALDRITSILKRAPSRTVAFFHVPFPHFPYQFEADGRIRKTILSGPGTYEDVEGYKDNLGYMDLMIGKILATLENRGDCGSSLIVLTSDHAWCDPDAPLPDQNDHETLWADDLKEWSYTRQVPLLIKHPGQKASRRFAQPVQTRDLHHLFDRYLRQPADTHDCEWWRPAADVSPQDADGWGKDGEVGHDGTE